MSKQKSAEKSATTTIVIPKDDNELLSLVKILNVRHGWGLPNSKAGILSVVLEEYIKSKHPSFYEVIYGKSGSSGSVKKDE